MIKQQIHNLLLQYPELAEDEVLREDMLAGSTDLNEALAVLLDRMRDSESMASAITDRIKTMQDRRKRIEDRQVSLRNVIFSLMQAADLPKVELPEATLYLRTNPPSAVITDESKLPDSVYETKQVRTLSKARVLQLLKVGETVDGAMLDNGGVSLVVRAS
jgi:hypothetical protein